MIKEFLVWIKLKETLHGKERIIPLVKERDLWWVSFGENIGSEINGKSEFFSRPGLVLKKLSRGFYLVAPTTDYRRLSSYLGKMDENDFNKAKDAFHKLYK